MNTLELEYEKDFHNWIEQHIALLKTNQVYALDTEHLIEELEEMGKSNIRELESRFIILIAHLLKWQFQLSTLTNQWQEFEGKSWRKTIIEQRLQLVDLLVEMPSLKKKLTDVIIKTYPKAIIFTVDEAGLPKETFPQTCPYTIEQLLDKNFYPDSQIGK